jgi:hypothetical protein
MSQLLLGCMNLLMAVGIIFGFGYAIGRIRTYCQFRDLVINLSKESHIKYHDFHIQRMYYKANKSDNPDPCGIMEPICDHYESFIGMIDKYRTRVHNI